MEHNRNKEIFELASMNAKSLEEILLTLEDVENLSKYDAEDVIERCNQIIRCMEIVLKDK